MRSGCSTILRWAAGCALAESIGMLAAASAARGVDASLPDDAGLPQRLTGVAVIVLAGLIEGISIGAAQAILLRWSGIRVSSSRWIRTTTVAAGLGWAIGSAPAALSTGEDTTGPPLWLILAGAATLGLVMGAGLGALQARLLRTETTDPGRWILASALAWTAGMVIIFTGATLPEPDWNIAAVLALAALTGAFAGSIIGVITGALTLGLRPPPSGHPGSSADRARHVLDAVRSRRADPTQVDR